MRARACVLGLTAAAFIVGAGGEASALNKRVEVVQEGDFVLIGNTLAHDCGSDGVASITGVTDCSNAGWVDDISPDIFWRAENGAATASASITPDQAQTAAALVLPAGAEVTHAYLYWSAYDLNGIDTAVTLQCGGAPLSIVNAASSFAGSGNTYAAAAEVTDYVKSNGACAYVVGGVGAHDFPNQQDSTINGYAAWWMAVLYKHSGALRRRLTIYDGLDDLTNGATSTVTLDVLTVPANVGGAGVAKVGVVAYEGDAIVTGDQLFLGDLPLSDCEGGTMNFFNGTRCNLGQKLSVPGDLPRYSGGAASMNRLDMDVLDVTSNVKGQVTTDLVATSLEPASLAGVVVSIQDVIDVDADGLEDAIEMLVGTDPEDADTDNDGLLDGMEGCSSPANCPMPLWDVDSDGDGLINALDADSDNDGLYDGTELGQACDNPATKAPAGSVIHCIEDADVTTTTDPLLADTDGGGALDGSEDANRNGKVDPEEQDPTVGHGADDAMVNDTDADGLSDRLEEAIGSQPNDADTDNDGLLDGDEPSPADDTDGDGLSNVLDVDSDNDGLFDGTEAGNDCSSPSTALMFGHCRPDADPTTTTWILLSDTDSGGAIDGSEDANLNGKLDPGEGDPTLGHSADDAMVKDSDMDGLSDGLEATLASHPNDPDSDDDGVPDGKEANPSNDEDLDGDIDVLDPDSDQDSIFDGTEGGYGCDGPGTDTDTVTLGCIPDGDKGATTTSMVNKDTDGDNIPDGAEDFNRNGVYEPKKGETDPTSPDDDIIDEVLSCSSDFDCGAPNDGFICLKDAKHCAPGCRLNMQGCPEGEVCTAIDAAPGECVPDGSLSSGSGGMDGEGEGCDCVPALGQARGPDAGGLVFALGGIIVMRRKRRQTKKRASVLGLMAAAFILGAGGEASALLKRADVVQEGDFVVIGNTLAHDCGLSGVAPVVGMTDCSNAGNVNDATPDIFWRAENGVATASASITPDQAQTAAVLALPAGAVVTHAYLYWSASLVDGVDSSATIQCIGAPLSNADAMTTLSGSSQTYWSAADVTDYVKTHGACTYVVGGVNADDYASNPLAAPYGHAGWSMSVLYTLSGAPRKRLVIYDGFDDLSAGMPKITIDMLTLPASAADVGQATLGVVAFQGSAIVSNDQFFIGNQPLDDCEGGTVNFFNGTRCNLGQKLSVPGDLPQYSGGAGSMNRLDIDVLDVTPYVKGQAKIDLSAKSAEPALLSAVVVGIREFTDADKDGLEDAEEALAGTDPNDADSDNDGLLDGVEGCSYLPNCPLPLWNTDSDGDGLINALDPDSDNDGLYDGTELGQNCDNPATVSPPGSLVHCIPDADKNTVTDPLLPDTDAGGVRDGSEDFNRNGKVDFDESDPTANNGADDAMITDSDGDELSDGLEIDLNSDPNDADSDNDGVLDGDEPNPVDDTDGDGLPNVIDDDSDNDGLFDGTEVGNDCNNPATDTSLGHCRADADPSTTTSMVSPDSDNGGVSDGSEDTNLNGKLDPGEGDPTLGHAADDAMAMDLDADGLSDGLETMLGSDPGDADSDDDGVLDGKEANPSDDTDGDGTINVLDPDSDGDMLFDGTETGYDCNGPGTFINALHCVPDGDKGKTKTSMVDNDSDDGGIPDGAEDFNKDGVYDAGMGEGNPNFPDDDINGCLCSSDANCGTPNDGIICGPCHCVPGCRFGSEGCPEGEVCTSTDDTPGECVSDGSPSSSSSSGSGGMDGGGEGCDCDAAGARDSDAGWLVFALGGAVALRRRRGRRSA